MNLFETSDGPSHITQISMEYENHQVRFNVAYDGEKRIHTLEIGK